MQVHQSDATAGTLHRALSVVRQELTRPLTDRVLARLPGPRGLWVVAWALVPALNAGLNLLLDTESKSAVWEQSRTLVILNYAAVTLAILITLWGTRRTAQRVDALRATTARVLHTDTSSTPFREMNGIAGPLVAAGATAAVFAVGAFVTDGLLQALLRGTTWFVLGVAF